MATREVFMPLDAAFPATNFPQLRQVQDADGFPRWVLAFNDTTDQACVFESVAPQGLTGTLTLVVKYFMASATSGDVRFGAQLEAVASGDSIDLDGGASSFDTANTAGDTVPGSAQNPKEFTITLTNADGLSAGKHFRLKFYRDADGTSGTDNASGDCYVQSVEFRDAA